MPSINRIPGWGSDKAPPPPAVQTWRPGQAHVEPELSGTWGPHRRTWGWGACVAGVHVRLGRTKGWRHMEAPASACGTRGVIVWRAARHLPAAGPGDWCGPTLQRSWSQCSSPGIQAPASPQASHPAGLPPLDGRHHPPKGVKVRSAHTAWVETFLANQDQLNDLTLLCFFRPLGCEGNTLTKFFLFYENYRN